MHQDVPDSEDKECLPGLLMDRLVSAGSGGGAGVQRCSDELLRSKLEMGTTPAAHEPGHARVWTIPSTFSWTPASMSQSFGSYVLFLHFAHAFKFALSDAHMNAISLATALPLQQLSKAPHLFALRT
jgi:hypothetical protein